MLSSNTIQDALRHGWVIEASPQNPEIYYLVPRDPSDPRRKWAATWESVTLPWFQVRFPDWFDSPGAPKRLQ